MTKIVHVKISDQWNVCRCCCACEGELFFIYLVLNNSFSYNLTTFLFLCSVLYILLPAKSPCNTNLSKLLSISILHWVAVPNYYIFLLIQFATVPWQPNLTLMVLCRAVMRLYRQCRCSFYNCAAQNSQFHAHVKLEPKAQYESWFLKSSVLEFFVQFC